MEKIFESHGSDRYEETLFSEDFKAALENNHSFIYIIDPESFEILYCNRAIRDLFQTDYVGRICYREFMNNEEICGFCPVQALMDTGEGKPIEALRPDGIWLLVQPSPLHWKGRNAIVLTCTDISRQKHAEEELRLQGEEYAAVVRQSGKCVIRYNLRTDTARTSFDADLNFGQEHEIPDFSQWLFSGHIIAEDSLDACRRLLDRMHSGKPEGSCNLRMYLPREDCRWYQVDYVLIVGAEESPARAIISFFDTTEHQEKELVYQKWKSNLASMLAENTIYMEINLTKDLIEREENLGEENQGRTGRRLTDFVEYGKTHITYEEDLPLFISFFDRQRLLDLYGSGRTEDQVKYRAVIDGRPQWFFVELQMVRDPFTNDVKAFVVYTNIDDALRERERLASAAERDSMTGLYNHATAQKLIESILAQDSGERCALLVVDLDDLGNINNTLGHPEGDKALRAVAGAMSSHFRGTDILGRIGGDEFIALLRDVPGAATLRNVIASFMKKVSDVRIGADGSHALHCSVGGVFGFAGKDEFEELYRKADRALYYVKSGGKNDFAFYIPEMENENYSYSPHAAITMTRTEWYESKEFKKLLEALAEFFPLVISVNLTQNSYYMMEYAQYATHKALNAGVFDELIEVGASTFHPDERGSFLDCFSRGNLLQAHARGETMVSHEGRQLGDDGAYRWIRTIVLFVNDESTDDVCQITLSHIINEEKQREMETLRLQKILQFTVTSSFEYICLLHTQTGRYELYANEGSNTHSVPQTGDFDIITAEIRDAHVLPEEREEYYNNARLGTVLRRMEETGGSYSYHYRLTDGEREAAFYWYEPTRAELLMTVRRV
ncbi:MAG: sensor domain-containing diguanylate cyclase, partial [Bacillota bacterium]|nr:sensor domain-containing diguanylate cyclase [Bacillota bacterium]